LSVTQRITVFKVFVYLSKRQDITSDAFIDYYENHHVPLVLSLAPMPRVYKRNYVVRGGAASLGPTAIDFDVITELVWDDRAGSEDWMSRLGVPEIAEDEARFLDRSKTRAHVIDERVSATG
jgi:EthD domain